MAAKILESIIQDEILNFTDKDGKNFQFQVIKIESNSKAIVENVQTGEQRTIKKYEGSWKMKGGLLFRK